MAVLRPDARFGTSLPSDDDFESEGEIPSGRNVTVALAELISAKGYTTSEPEQWQINGWGFFAQQDKFFWFAVNVRDQGEPGERDLFVNASASFWSSLFRPEKGRFENFMRQLNAELQADPRFYDIRWYRAGRSHSGDPGEPSPI